MFNSICEFYNIIPKNIDIMRNAERVLAKIQTETNESYYLKGEPANQSHWESGCKYATFLSENGLNTPTYRKTKEGTYTISLNEKVFSLELALLGKPIKKLDDQLLATIGSSFGIQHRLSSTIISPLTTATSWSLFGGNKTDEIGDYDENELSFRDFKNTYSTHRLFSKVERLYLTYRLELKQVWDKFPQGAVQGDFCYYNMLLKENQQLAIYDFNLAGNEVYLNECVAVGVYHSWHVDYIGTLSKDERFLLFMNAYQEERALNQVELQYLLKLKAIIRAFRFDRIEDGISIKNTEVQDEFLEETLKILLLVD
ncbi:hypothetical protein ACQKMD_20975 [Viridibacillus sp. NPDC096237]|uniref:hypothetical protein n=1 Tax=Viridibacillus sp. NPDC096237 TaxID=3390721 RepID=UPI003CFED490